VDDHAIMQARDGFATGVDEQPWNERMDQAGQRGAKQRDPEPEGVTLMLQVRFSDGSRMVEE